MVGEQEDCDRLGQIVYEARRRLQPLARSTKEKVIQRGAMLGDYVDTKTYYGMGGENGCGVLIRIANVKTDGQGHVSPHELARFGEEMSDVFEGLQTSINSMMINDAVSPRTFQPAPLPSPLPRTERMRALTC